MSGAGVLFFVLLLRLFLDNKRQTKMKMKVSVKLIEQKNCGNAHHKYAIKGFDRHLPYYVDFAVTDVIFLLLLSSLFKISVIRK